MHGMDKYTEYEMRVEAIGEKVSSSTVAPRHVIILAGFECWRKCSESSHSP